MLNSFLNYFRTRKAINAAHEQDLNNVRTQYAEYRKRLDVVYDKKTRRFKKDVDKELDRLGKLSRKTEDERKELNRVRHEIIDGEFDISVFKQFQRRKEMELENKIHHKERDIENLKSCIEEIKKKHEQAIIDIQYEHGKELKEQERINCELNIALANINATLRSGTNLKTLEKQVSVMGEIVDDAVARQNLGLE